MHNLPDNNIGPVSYRAKTAASSRLASSRRSWSRPLLGWLVTFKIVIATLLAVPAYAPQAAAQYDDSNPAVYWRLERQRQKKFKRQRVRQRRVIIQRPTRFIRRARPRRGYTRTVPVNRTKRAADPVAIAKPQNTTEAQPGSAAAASPSKPEVPAKPPEPAMHIAVLGDNIASQLARGLSQTYEETPQIEIMRLAKDNSGLVRKDYFDWNAAVTKLLSGDKKVDVAIMMIGSNDRQSIRDETGVHAPSSPGWEKIYIQRIEAITAQFKQKNIPLIWLGMPVMRLERLSTDMARFNRLYREAVQKNGGIYIDIWEAFLDDRNRFTLYGPDVNGQTVKLRVSDGVHFTKAGARKVAHFAELDIKRIIDKRKKLGPADAISGIPSTIKIPGSPNNTTDGNAGKSLQAALPVPAAPAKVIVPVKPAVGPVVQLTAEPLAPNGLLIDQPAAKQSPNAPQIVSGAPANAQTGRADDFSWPKNK